GRLRRLAGEVAKHEAAVPALEAKLLDWQVVIHELEPVVNERQAAIGTLLADGAHGEEVAAYFKGYQRMDRWLTEARTHCRTLREQLGELSKALDAAATKTAGLEKE